MIRLVVHFTKTKGHKYRAKPTIVDGIRFDSKKEARHYARLKLALQAGEIRLLLRQVPFYISDAVFDENGKVLASAERYVADFLVHWKDGTLSVIDAKGHRTQTYRRKKRRVEAIYGITIEEV